MKKIRVVLADDHPIVRSGIRNLLNRTPDITVIGEACNGNEAIQLSKELNPDILLLDMEMPGLGGVDVARNLNRDRSPVKILVLSAYNDKEYITQLLNLGAAGYLIKDEAPTTIVEAVRGVANGQRGWLSEVIAQRMVEWKQEAPQPAANQLSPREREVLRLLAEGATDQTISDTLSISETALKHCLQTLFDKLGVSTRADAIHRMLDQS